MARKYSLWKVHLPFISSITGAFLLSAGFMVLQQLCMNHASMTFVNSTCLSDSHTRTLVSVYLTASAFFLTTVVSAAVNAYRVAQLQRGIEEGVYIAMTPSAPYKYQVRAMNTRWWLAIAAVLALSNAPGWIQPLANLGLTTNSVYVRNNSTAQLAVGVGSYNAAALEAYIDMLVAEQQSVQDMQDTIAADVIGQLGAFSVLTNLREFAGGQGSMRAANGSVTTPVVRSNLVGSTLINGVDASNAFKQTGLVATLTADCADVLQIAPLLQLLPNSSNIIVIVNNVNETTSAGSGKTTSVIISDVSFAVESPTIVDFVVTYFLGYCINCTPLRRSTAVNGTLTTCRARASFAVQDFVFNVASGTVTQLGMTTANINDTGQLDPNVAGLLTAAIAVGSLNGNLSSSSTAFQVSLLQLPISFPNGLFESSNSNYIYSTLCTALSQSLGSLWVFGATQPGDNPAMGAANVIQTVTDATETVPLYGLQLVTYIPIWTAAVLVGALLGCMLVVGLWGMVWCHLCSINIKEATDTTLIDNVDDAFITKKRTAGASNDPDLQMARAFSDDRGGLLLFARATNDAMGKGQRLVISNDPSVGWTPDKTIDYI